MHCIDFLHSGINSTLTWFFVFDCNISYFSTLKKKKELFLFVLLSFFITLINLDSQIWGTQTWCTVVNFGLNEPLIYIYFLFLSNTNGSHRKYAQGFKKRKSYCIGIKSIKWTRQVYGEILRTFGYFI